MGYDPGRHHRRSIRLPGYDYTQAGAYFVTICTQERACLFGEVVEGVMRLDHPGQMVAALWDDLSLHYPGVDTDAFVVMPNHIHGIIVLVGAGPRARPDSHPGQPRGPDPGQPRGVAPTLSLPDVVHRFKTLTTKRYSDGVRDHGWTPFPGRLWQRNYYERVVRSDAELRRIQEYIAMNPAQWAVDDENPIKGGQP